MKEREFRMATSSRDGDTRRSLAGNFLPSPALAMALGAVFWAHLACFSPTTTRDAGVAADAGVVVDASVDAPSPALDAGGTGTGSGRGDAASPDAGQIEAGPNPRDGDMDSGTFSEAGPPDAALSDASAPDAGISLPPPTGQVIVDSCLGETGVDEKCILVTDASACTETKCTKLVLIFSGGEMGCTTGVGYSDVIAGYAANGYAAVCINYFETSTGSAQKPYVDEASRIDLAVREATRGAWAQAYWTGEDLLLEGISHGATAPVILMARTNLDLQAHWHGSRRTAGCFFDGIYDPVATANLLATGGLGCGLLYNRILKRYCGPGATAATCDLSAQPKVQEDTITQVLPIRFAMQNFKMYECGSGLNPCTGDMVAAEPIEELCLRLEASPLRSCEYNRLPFLGHASCHASRYDECRVWFEGLSAP